MPTTRFATWTAVLLGLAGAGMVPFGWRAVRLERDETAVRLREALVWGARRAVRAAEEPETPPEESWTLVEPSANPIDVTGDDGLLLAQAEYLERTQDDPAAAAAIFERLALRGDSAPATFLAAVRGGALAVRREEGSAASRFLDVAARAPADVADAGLPVPLLAAYHRAALDLREGRVETTAAFLAAAGEGRRVAAGDAVGPDDLIGSLRARAGDLAPPALLAAADRAERARRALRRTPVAGIVVVDGDVYRRVSNRLESRALASLLRADETPPGVDLRLAEVAGTAPDPERAVDFGPPLSGVRLEAMSTRSSGGTLLFFAAAFAVYVLGAFLAVSAIRRSERAARMQADFVAAVSHEMKTPIASVRAMAEMLSNGVADEPARARRYAERIEHEMRRLGASVRNVLDAARIERMEEIPLSKRPVEPARIVEESVAAVMPAFERRGLRVSLTARPLGREAALDEDALQGVIANLLDNAAKYSGTAREIEVDAGPAEDGVEYRVRVLDRGIGVSADERSRLFERFFRGAAAKRAAIPGVGLGLHVARSVARAHGGDLAFESRDGGGSAFVLRLPVGEAP